jgi:hypothetical protein
MYSNISIFRLVKEHENSRLYHLFYSTLFNALDTPITTSGNLKFNEKAFEQRAKMVRNRHSNGTVAAMICKAIRSTSRIKSKNVIKLILTLAIDCGRNSAIRMLQKDFRPNEFSWGAGEGCEAYENILGDNLSLAWYDEPCRSKALDDSTLEVKEQQTVISNTITNQTEPHVLIRYEDRFLTYGTLSGRLNRSNHHNDIRQISCDVGRNLLSGDEWLRQLISHFELLNLEEDNDFMRCD